MKLASFMGLRVGNLEISIRIFLHIVQERRTLKSWRMFWKLCSHLVLPAC